MENTVNKDRSRLRSSLRRIAAAGLFGLCSLSAAFAQKQDYVQYVNTLQGTDSKFELSYGNTYATTGMPYGMHTWAHRPAPTAKAGNTSTRSTRSADSNRRTSAARG